MVRDGFSTPCHMSAGKGSRDDARGRRISRGLRTFPGALHGFFALFALCSSQVAPAIGLGGFEVQSSLGQRLRMVVQVTARADETLDASCFKINPFAVASDGLPQ